MWKAIISSALLLQSARIACADPPSPYVGLQDREIKALSQQEVQDYREGKGMGFAKTAELNHFPGPAHVLDLADKLRLTPEQKQRTERIFAAMQHNAKNAGRTLVEKERELDELFSTRKIDESKLRALLDDIGRVHAEIRRIHLQAHLAQQTVLTSAQVTAYDELRGYSSPGTRTHGEHPQRH